MYKPILDFEKKKKKNTKCTYEVIVQKKTKIINVLMKYLYIPL